MTFAPTLAIVIPMYVPCQRLWLLPFVAAIGCGVLAAGCGRRPASRPKVVDPDAPRLVVPEEPLRLGKVIPGEEVTAYIPLRNAGRQPLTISNIETGCGCATADVPSEPLPPGGEFQLRLRTHLKTEGQDLKLPMRISSNDPSSPVTSYTVWVEAAPPILRLEPAQVDFGEVPVASSPIRVVQILKADAKPWPAEEPLTIEASQGAVEVKLLTSPSEGAKLRIQPRQGIPPGSMQDLVTVRPTGSSRFVRLQVLGSIVPKFIITPGTLYLGDLGREKSPIERFVQVRRTDGEALGDLEKWDAPAGIAIEHAAQEGTPSPSRGRLRILIEKDQLPAGFTKGQVKFWLTADKEPLQIRIEIRP